MSISIQIDGDACLAHGDCAVVAPDVFAVDDVARVVGTAPDDVLIAAARPAGRRHRPHRRRDGRAGLPVARLVAARPLGRGRLAQRLEAHDLAGRAPASLVDLVAEDEHAQPLLLRDVRDAPHDLGRVRHELLRRRSDSAPCGVVVSTRKIGAPTGGPPCRRGSRQLVDEHPRDAAEELRVGRALGAQEHRGELLDQRVAGLGRQRPLGIRDVHDRHARSLRACVGWRDGHRHRPRPPCSDRQEELLALLTEIQAASREDEGCVNYGYYAAIDDLSSLIAVEEWRDADALAAHLRQPHVARLVEALPDMLAAPPEIISHDVARSGPIPLPR